MAIYIQPPLFDIETDWRPTPVSELPSWAEAKRVAVDLETHDPKLTSLGPGVRRDGRVVGVSFAIEDGPAFYLPIAHAIGENLPADHVWAYLADQARAFRGDIVGANLPYDLDYMAENGTWFGACRFFRDVQIAEPLLNELQMSYSLESISENWGVPGKEVSGLEAAARAWGTIAWTSGGNPNPQINLWRLPARHVARYAIQDVRLPLTILRRQERDIDAQGLWNVYDLESRVLPVLVKMRRRGVRVDEAQLAEVEAFVTQEERKASDAAGMEFGSITDPAATLAALERAIPGCSRQLPLTAGPKKKRADETDEEFAARREASRKPSVAAAALDALDIDHPVFAAILRARRMNKIRTTFVESVREHLVRGRIHCTMNQLRNQREEGDLVGAAYGRMSCSDPNLQQQPARDKELGPLWRSIYVPEDGQLWACADYSQQEPRMTVHYAVLSRSPGAEEFANVYRQNPDADCYELVAKAAGIERGEAKGIFLGLCYGMGPAKLCHKLELPTTWIVSRRTGKPVEVAGEEGDRLMQIFHSRVPFVKDLADLAEMRARARGYITTIAGRRCRFPKDQKGDYDWTFKALNRLIQGSSADQTKTAMVELDQAGIAIQLQIHDEIDWSVANRAEAEQAAVIMRDCVKLEVPCKVGLTVEKHWGLCK